jgi:ATP-binding cassette subfamily B protein
MNRERSVLRRGLRVVAPHVATHPGPFVVAVAGATLYAAMTVATSFVLGRTTDRVPVPAFRSGAGVGTVLWGAGALLAVGVVRAGGIVARRYFAGMTGSRLRATLTTRVVEQYQRLPLAYHRARPTGELITRAEADVQAAVDVVHPLPWSLAEVLLAVLATVALFLTDPFLAAIGLLVLPALAVASRAYSARVEEPAARAQRHMAEVAAVAHESLDGALVVKTLGREEAEVERFRHRTEAFREARVRMGGLRGASSRPSRPCPPWASLSSSPWAPGGRRGRPSRWGPRPVREPLRAARLPHAAHRLRALRPPPVRGGAGAGAGGAGRAREPGAAAGGRGRQAAARPSGARRAVRELRLRAARGPGRRVVRGGAESVAIVGPTGSGKSTLAHLLVRLADPDRGSIELGGVDLRRLNEGDLRRAAAIVLQETFLFASTVRDNLTLGLEVSDEEVEWAARVAQADRFVRALPRGYGTDLGERGATLSGGSASGWPWPGPWSAGADGDRGLGG